jgi:hypothetical protein
VLFTGLGDRYWSEVKENLRPGDAIATVIDPDMWYSQTNFINYTLTGVGDFPAYFKVRCLSGYSQTAPLGQLAVKAAPFYWFGAYAPIQMAAVKSAHPEVRFIRVWSFHPLRMTLSSPDGPDIDLLPMTYR